MQKLLIAILSGSCLGCNFKTDFVKHSISLKEAGVCAQRTEKVNMVSNTNGQRYEFDYCLPKTTSEPVYTVERAGDTLRVSFATKGETLYKITLDIDTNPPYHFIRLGDQLIALGTVGY